GGQGVVGSDGVCVGHERLVRGPAAVGDVDDLVGDPGEGMPRGGVAVIGYLVVRVDAEDGGDAVDFGPPGDLGVLAGEGEDVPAELADGDIGVVVEVVGELAEAADDLGSGEQVGGDRAHGHGGLLHGVSGAVRIWRSRSDAS